MSPSLPAPPCRVCRRLGCTVHGPASGRRIPRPANKAEINRRKATVDAWRERYGDWCPVCGKRGVKLSADHVYSVGRGGREDGPLRVI